MTLEEWERVFPAEGDAQQPAPPLSGMPVDVLLTWYEVRHAGMVGLERALMNFERRARERNGDTGTFVDRAILGTIGEKALAKHKNRYWSGNVGDYQAADVDGWQVRGTRTEKTAAYMHKWDKHNDIFVSALVQPLRLPVVTLRGWFYGYEGMQTQFWGLGERGVRPCFFVDPAILHDMSSLPEAGHLPQVGAIEAAWPSDRPVPPGAVIPLRRLGLA